MEKYEEQIIRQNMQQIVGGVDAKIPEGWGCAVLIFPFNNDGGTLLYGATAEREDIVNVMKEFIVKTENNWGKDITILD